MHRIVIRLNARRQTEASEFLELEVPGRIVVIEQYDARRFLLIRLRLNLLFQALYVLRADCTRQRSASRSGATQLSLLRSPGQAKRPHDNNRQR